MARSGIYGFRKNGVDKITYNRLYSEPNGLGTDFIEFLLSCTKEQLDKLYNNIVLVDRTVAPTEGQIKICTDRDWADRYARPERTAHDIWYNLLRLLQSNFEEYKARCIDANDFVYMTDDKQNFLNSSECLYAYIYDLDTNTLEFYRGPYDKKDFATLYTGHEKANTLELYPPKLCMELHLDGIRAVGIAQVIAMMNDCIL